MAKLARTNATPNFEAKFKIILRNCDKVIGHHILRNFINIISSFIPLTVIDCRFNSYTISGGSSSNTKGRFLLHSKLAAVFTNNIDIISELFPNRFSIFC